MRKNITKEIKITAVGGISFCKVIGTGDIVFLCKKDINFFKNCLVRA
jgi:hypothetical protein